jgi:hypothetical protein
MAEVPAYVHEQVDGWASRCVSIAIVWVKTTNKQTLWPLVGTQTVLTE